MNLDFSRSGADAFDHASNDGAGGGYPVNSTSESAANGAPKQTILTGDEGPSADELLNITPQKKQPQGLFARLFNNVSKKTIMDRAKDIGAGMAISGAARYAILCNKSVRQLILQSLMQVVLTSAPTYADQRRYPGARQHPV